MAASIIDIRGTAADAQRMDRDLDKLAPGFRADIEAVCDAMRALGHDPLIVEVFRTDARQEWLYAQGRTRSGNRVTNARSASVSVHGYGLAVDIVCNKKYWNATAKFWSDLGKCAKEQGLRWGGDFKSIVDRPHIQTGAWQGSPPQWARDLRAKGDLQSIWQRLGLDASPETTDSTGPQRRIETPLAWGAKVSPEFREKVRAISARLGCDPSDLMACMQFESGISPSRRNRAGSGATGLIQFMPATARGLGTTTDALAAMSAVDQLDYVEKYFKPYIGRLKNIDDLYMAILWPRAVGKSEDYVLFEKGTRAYEQNSGLDTNRDGLVTKAEAASKPRRALEQGMRAENLG